MFEYKYRVVCIFIFQRLLKFSSRVVALVREMGLCRNFVGFRFPFFLFLTCEQKDGLFGEV